MSNNVSNTAAEIVPDTPTPPPVEDEKGVKPGVDFDFSDDAIAKLAEEQEVSSAQASVAPPAVEAPTTPTPQATPATTEPAATDTSEEPSVVRQDDGSWLINGKYRGATLEDAARAQAKAYKEAERRVHEMAEERKLWEQQQAELEQDGWWEEQQAPDPLIPPAGGAAHAANELVAIQAIERMAETNPQRAAHAAIFKLDQPDEELYKQVMRQWAEEDPENAQAFHLQMTAELDRISAEYEAQHHAAMQHQQQVEQYAEYVQEFEADQQRIQTNYEALTEFQQAHPDADPSSPEFNPQIKATIEQIIERDKQAAHEQGQYAPMEIADGNPMMIRMVMDAAYREAKGVVGQQSQDAQIIASKESESPELGTVSGMNINTMSAAPGDVVTQIQKDLLGLA